MFTYLPAYRVLICVEHYHAVYGLDEHLKRHYSLLAARRRELRAAYAGLAINAPKHVTLLASGSAPKIYDQMEGGLLLFNSQLMLAFIRLSLALV
jgi:hypothetical protein